MPDDVLPWSVAWERAAFGPDGFYRPQHPGSHFATDVMDGDAVARRMARLIEPVTTGLLVTHATVTVTDAGADDGRLLRQLAELMDPALAERITWRAIDIRPRPAGLPAWLSWIQGDVRDLATHEPPAPGVVIAHELLDDVPCDVLEIDDEGRRRVVLVDPASGAEVLGPPLSDAAACSETGLDAAAIDAWCDLWWPRREPAARIEVGTSRDALWAALARTVSVGLAVAVDYGHVASERARGEWDGGTLSGFRGGRAVSVVADGSCNLTAHVAMDACAAAVPPSRSRLERSREGWWWLVQEMGR